MHDSRDAISVQNLTSALAQQFRAIAEHVDGNELLTFTLAFWETMAREYTNVDALRMDKLLLLMRLSVREHFRLILDEASNMMRDHSDTRIRDELMTAFEKLPLSVRERKVPDGIRYHVLDLWVEELDLVRSEQTQQAVGDKAQRIESSTISSGTANGKRDTDGVAQATERLISLLLKLVRECPTKQVRIHAKDAVAAAVEKGLIQVESPS